MIARKITVRLHGATSNRHDPRVAIGCVVVGCGAALLGAAVAHAATLRLVEFCAFDWMLLALLCGLLAAAQSGAARVDRTSGHRMDPLDGAADPVQLRRFDSVRTAIQNKS